MKRWTWITYIALLLVSTSHAQQATTAPAHPSQNQASNRGELFEDPVALKDTDGNDLITGLAMASPYAADYDGDGVNDLVLGAHSGMDSELGSIWLVRNAGSNAQPRFDWKNVWPVEMDDGQPAKVDCGCKEAGFVPVLSVDRKGDGWMDLVYTDSFRRAYLLTNTRTSRREPTFTQSLYFDFGRANHAMNSGGGDWNGDGIPDFLFMPYGGQSYVLYPGIIVGGTGLKFADGPVEKGRDLKITGQKAGNCAWAWNFSGRCKAGEIEYVGVEGESREIGFYKVEAAVSRRLGTLAVSDGQLPKVTACDLNGDGRMDILYSSGVFEKPEVTKVYVMYGKVKNIAAPVKSRPPGQP